MTNRDVDGNDFEATARPFVHSDEGDLDSMPIVRTHVAAHRSGLGDLFDRSRLFRARRRVQESLLEHAADMRLVSPEPHHGVPAAGLGEDGA